MICLYKIAAGFTFIITQDIFAFLQINPVPELMKPILCNDLHIRIPVDHIKDLMDGFFSEVPDIKFLRRIEAGAGTYCARAFYQHSWQDIFSNRWFEAPDRSHHIIRNGSPLDILCFLLDASAVAIVILGKKDPAMWKRSVHSFIGTDKQSDLALLTIFTKAGDTQCKFLRAEM